MPRVRSRPGWKALTGREVTTQLFLHHALSQAAIPELSATQQYEFAS